MSNHEHEDAILEWLDQWVGRSDAVARRYARAAAKWSLLRLKRYRGEAGEAEERQYAVLTALVRKLSGELGMRLCTEGEPREARIGDKVVYDVNPVPGITTSTGHLPCDRGAYIIGDTWQDAVAVFHGLCNWQQGDQSASSSRGR
ncbi:hypothetical protein A5692_23510 [Mycobacterium sp. E342]|uniref:hypothetical protein n=1 Tax=Mycobacterium sp. E342 TaxID=1834147 RepID=UPI0007FF44F9|nr:hypothetical protein [Mycobacterium sp. E342]OBH28058.1 hypothetical protein A5692_23510 [Mycobacterium sp. E342]